MEEKLNGCDTSASGTWLGSCFYVAPYLYAPAPKLAARNDICQEFRSSYHVAFILTYSPAFHSVPQDVS